MNYLTYVMDAHPAPKINKKTGYKSYLKQAVYKCCCGKELIVRMDMVNSGDRTSCGCQKNKHRKRRTPSGILYIWNLMKNRCNNSKNKNYKDYGGRGITVCDRWVNKFENFLEDMGERPTNEYTIDRVDNDKGYYKENCRWATRKEQARNKRNTNYIEYKGEIRPLVEWAEIVNINYQTLNHRLYNMNWTPDEAFTIPPSLSNRRTKRT